MVGMTDTTGVRVTPLSFGREALSTGALVAAIVAGLAAGPLSTPLAHKAGNAGYLVLNDNNAPVSDVPDFEVDASDAAMATPAPTPAAVPLSDVEKDIVHAARALGLEPALMLAIARQESGLNPTAESSNTTASGLFQFTRVTWMRMVHSYGKKHGLSDLAAKISIDDRGRVVVDDTKSRSTILTKRLDPKLSSIMAAELMADNKARVERSLGRGMNSVDLYFTHFLGTNHSIAFLRAYHHHPKMIAAKLLPVVSQVNKALFYDGKRPLTVSEVYEQVSGLISGYMDNYPQLQQVASNDTTSLIAN